MAIFLTEQDVNQLLTIEDALAVAEEVVRGAGVGPLLQWRPHVLRHGHEA